MDRKTLEQYPDVVADIADKKLEIKLLRGQSVEMDTVRGSMPDFPYSSHPIAISGVVDSEELRKKQLELAELKALKKEMDDFYKSLPNHRLKKIVRLKWEGKQFKDIAALIGEPETDSSVKNKYYRIFSKKF